MPLPPLQGFAPPMPTNFGELNGNYAQAVQSLAASAMQPDQQNPDTSIFANYNGRRQAPRSSARTSPQGTNSPQAQALMAAKQQGANPNVNWAGNTGSFVQPGGVPAATPQVIRGGQPVTDAVPQDTTLGEQAGGGRNVQVIRGGHSTIEHMNASGTPTGEVQAPQQRPTAAAPKPQGFNASNEQSIFQYRDAERQVGHLDSQIQRIESSTMYAPDQQAQMLAPLHQQRDALQHQMTDLGRQLAKWSPENAAAGQREQQAEQEVSQAGATMHPPTEVVRHLDQADPQALKIAQQIMAQVGGDPKKAAEYAKAHGYSF